MMRLDLDFDEDEFEECPQCCNGYMLPYHGDWYKCNSCGAEAKIDDYGLLWFEN